MEGAWGNPQKNTSRAGGWDKSVDFCFQVTSAPTTCHSHENNLPIGVSEGGAAPLEGAWGNPQKNTSRAGGWDKSVDFCFQVTSAPTTCHSHENNLPIGVSEGGAAPLEGAWGNPQKNTSRAGGWDKGVGISSSPIPQQADEFSLDFPDRPKW